MTAAPDEVTEVAQNLTEIVDLVTHLEAQAIHDANDHELPGGDAMVALAHVASPEAWEHIYEAAEANGYDVSHVADEDDSAEPPLQTLLFWSEQWRVEHNRESDRRPTVISEANFIRYMLNWAWENEVHFRDFARDVKKAKGKLEAVLYAGKRNERGVQCFDCRVDLVRQSWDRKILHRCDGHDGICYLPHAHCPHDRGGLRDEWKCPSCQRTYGVEDYWRAVSLEYFLRADWLPVAEAAERTGVKSGTIKVWANRGKVRKRKDQESGRMTYNVGDIQERHAEDDSPDEVA